MNEVKVGWSTFRLEESRGEYRIARKHVDPWTDHVSWQKTYKTKTYKNLNSAQKAFEKFINNKREIQHNLERKWTPV
jgi:hypothetical protein